MTQEKWIGFSRGLWAQVMIYAAGAIGFAKAVGWEVPPDLLDHIDSLGVGAIGVIGAGLAIWSKLRPSPRALRAAPRLSKGTARLSAILGMLLLPWLIGCAWSHYETAQADTTMKCWSIVWGGGKLGADCGKTKAKLSSEDTGFSDNAAPTFEAIARSAGIMAGAAAREATPP